MPEPPLAPPSRRRKLWRRFGLAGVLFFLFKGLLWILVPTMLWLESCSAAALVAL